MFGKKNKEATKTAGKARQAKKKREPKPYDGSLNLSPEEGSTFSKKRLGRGPGSGLGKTSGRGQKGQGSRSGSNSRPGFEGGQMPLQRRIPKRGFTNVLKIEYQVINLSDLDIISGEETINKNLLLQQRIINKKNLPIKLLANGDINKAITIEVDKASKMAIEKIEKAGGKIIFPEVLERRKKFEKKDTSAKVSRKLKKYQNG